VTGGWNRIEVQAGDKIGPFTLVRRAGENGCGQAVWLMQCDEGHPCEHAISQLRMRIRRGEMVKCKLCERARRARHRAVRNESTARRFLAKHGGPTAYTMGDGGFDAEAVDGALDELGRRLW